jgi:hypothetical protein
VVHDVSRALLFPFSLVWKRLVGAPLTLGDIHDIDVDSARVLSAVAQWSPPEHLDPSAFNDAAATAAFEAAFPQLTFSVVSIDGRVIDLVPRGAQQRVTLATRAAWLELQVQHRLTAYDAPLAAMQRGLFGTVPARALRLLTWSELEVAVSGRAAIDVKLLRAHTGECLNRIGRLLSDPLM